MRVGLGGWVGNMSGAQCRGVLLPAGVDSPCLRSVLPDELSRPLCTPLASLQSLAQQGNAERIMELIAALNQYALSSQARAAAAASVPAPSLGASQSKRAGRSTLCSAHPLLTCCRLLPAVQRAQGRAAGTGGHGGGAGGRALCAARARRAAQNCAAHPEQLY